MVNHVKKPDWLKIDFRSNDQFANNTPPTDDDEDLDVPAFARRKVS